MHQVAEGNNRLGIAERRTGSVCERGKVVRDQLPIASIGVVGISEIDLRCAASDIRISVAGYAADLHEIGCIGRDICIGQAERVLAGPDIAVLRRPVLNDIDGLKIDSRISRRADGKGRRIVSRVEGDGVACHQILRVAEARRRTAECREGRRRRQAGIETAGAAVIGGDRRGDRLDVQ